MAVVRGELGTFLSLLSEADREALLKRGGHRTFQRGEHLMHQGEPGDRVLVLLEGHAKTSHVDEQGRETVFSFRGPGDVLGELTFTTAAPRSGNVTAIEPVSSQAFAAQDFRAYLEQRPTAALTLIEVISRRFRYANEARVEFGDLDTVGRVAARLIELSERYGEQTQTGTTIRLPITQEDLGSWTASSRASIAGALRILREEGWIHTERRRITVLDPHALARRAG